MGWLDRVREWLRPERRTITWADFPADLLNPKVAAGVAVTERTALEYPAFRNGVVLISSDVGKIPRHPYERLPDGSRKRLDGTYLDRLFRQPNPYINDLDLWATATAHALVCGDGYLEIEWDNALRPIALWPIAPERITPVCEPRTDSLGRQMTRVYYQQSGRKPVESEDIIHIKGPSWDGVKGDKTVSLARQALGLGIASERFAGSFYGNGAVLGLILEHPGTLTDGAHKRIRASIDGAHRGPDNAFKTFIAEEGMKANAVGMPLKEAQFAELRDFQIVETARVLNLPPHKLKHKMGERPGNNLTESELDYLAGTLDPWLTRIEQECNLKLIPKAKRGDWYIEHDRNAYLRMTPEAKAESYKAYYDMKVLSSEQIAKKENLPAPDPDDFPKPPPAGVTPGQSAPPPVDEKEQAAAERALVVDQVSRFMRMEADRVKKAAKRGATGFAEGLEEFYVEGQVVLRGHLVPVLRVSLARRGVKVDPEAAARALAQAYVEQSKEELLGLSHRDLADQAERLVSAWAPVRPLEMAERVHALVSEE